MSRHVRLDFNPFAFLRLPLDVTERQIKDKRKKLALKHHPDRGGDAEMMKKVNLACDVLLNENTRNQIIAQLRPKSQVRMRVVVHSYGFDGTSTTTGGWTYASNW